MLSLFKRNDNANAQTGVYSGSEGVAVVQVRGTGDAKPKLTHCAFELGDASDCLPRALKSLPNRKIPAVSVLHPTGYRMLLVEAPDVPGEELRAAVRWRIKDLIDFHIDDAVIDVFQMPSQGRGGPNKMMYAVAARAERVREQVGALEEAGLNLQAVDVLELSLRNIAALFEREGRGVALLSLATQGGLLLLVRQGVLYLTRRIDTGTETLAKANGLRSELVAGMALEARRSLDYFESHYEQSSIPVLYTSGLDPADQDQLTSELGISVRNIDLNAILETDVPLDPELQRRCMPAIGAALRRDKVAL